MAETVPSPSLHVLMQVCRRDGITTRPEYRDALAKGKLPAGSPGDLTRAYKHDQDWLNLAHFFGNWHSIESCIKLAKLHSIRNLSAWSDLVHSECGPRDRYAYPIDLKAVFPNEHEKVIPLVKAKLPPPEKPVVSFEDCRDTASTLHFNSKEQYAKAYRAESNEGTIYESLAYAIEEINPVHYKDEWRGWSHFLGKRIDSHSADDTMFDYDAARQFFQDHPCKDDIYSIMHWMLQRDAVHKGKIRATKFFENYFHIPEPHKYGDEFISWADFLGHETHDSRYDEYGVCQAYAHSFSGEFKRQHRRRPTIGDWLKYTRTPEFNLRCPQRPDFVHAGKFKSWKDFLNTENTGLQGLWLPWADFRTEIRALDVTVEQFALLASDHSEFLPPFCPTNPKDVYKADYCASDLFV